MRIKQAIQLTLKACFMLAVMTACQTNKTDWVPKVYKANPILMGIERKDDVISCASTKFKHFTCLTDNELSYLYSKCIQEKQNWWELWN